MGGDNGLGPSDYWLNGFIVLNEQEGKRITDNYSWEDAEIDFEPGMEPEVTELSNFSWKSGGQCRQDCGPDREDFSRQC